LDALQSPAAATGAADCDGVFAGVWANEAVEIMSSAAAVISVFKVTSMVGT
jgi:hypothetical protein